LEENTMVKRKKGEKPGGNREDGFPGQGSRILEERIRMPGSASWWILEKGGSMQTRFFPRRVPGPIQQLKWTGLIRNL